MSEHLPETDYLDPELLQKLGDIELPLTTQPERIRDDYLANLNAYLTALRAGCVGANIDYKTVDTSRPLDGVLNEFFAERAATLTGAAVGARL